MAERTRIPIAGVAVVDVAATLLVAALTAKYMHLSLVLCILLWFAVGELVHVLLRVDTPISRRLAA